MKKLLIITIATIMWNTAFSQVSINTDGSQANASAILDLKSTSKGFLLPRMTTWQLKNISNPAAGLLVFNTDSSDFYGFNGNAWISMWKSTDTITCWVCGDPITDIRDGSIYATVLIGSQCWMAENLNIGTMINNTPTDNGLIEKFCYAGQASNCDMYGGLYDWNEMMQYTTGATVQGICPAGWHLPGDAEWCTMTTYVDPTVNCNVYAWNGTNIGFKLKSTSGWYNGWNGSDAVGFTGLPGGVRVSVDFYDYLTTYGEWWSADSYNESKAWYRSISCYQNDMGRFNLTKSYGLSVRCIKD
ncbi:MAG: hypothetical protein A2W85_06285 [Bacteroidetes bacterium GWF2_41_31]|nr:MAG: hypothetical protein A2W85_06285 [Bacteroidetes bacterium GWF2_41_31]OFZ09445.1 MAG: hypothetical protein A2338_00780 [Bacteroidetes bacterium RIFOXYB12_FULL_41_6]